MCANVCLYFYFSPSILFCVGNSTFNDKWHENIGCSKAMRTKTLNHTHNLFLWRSRHRHGGNIAAVKKLSWEVANNNGISLKSMDVECNTHCVWLNYTHRLYISYSWFGCFCKKNSWHKNLTNPFVKKERYRETPN